MTVIDRGVTRIRKNKKGSEGLKRSKFTRKIENYKLKLFVNGELHK